jgi:hypothetical protein
LIETYAGSPYIPAGHIPLKSGQSLFIPVDSTAVMDTHVEVINHRWSHGFLPEDPRAYPETVSAHAGTTVYPRGVFVTVLRGVFTIPVADISKQFHIDGTPIGPS